GVLSSGYRATVSNGPVSGCPITSAPWRRPGNCPAWIASHAEKKACAAESVDKACHHASSARLIGMGARAWPASLIHQFLLVARVFQRPPAGLARRLGCPDSRL